MTCTRNAFTTLEYEVSTTLTHASTRFAFENPLESTLFVSLQSCVLQQPLKLSSPLLTALYRSNLYDAFATCRHLERFSLEWCWMLEPFYYISVWKAI